jgi:hypothetical protein
MIAQAEIVRDDYLHWLRGNMIEFQREGRPILSTPFLDPFNDGIEIAIDTQGSEYLLHDSGKTIENLLDMGVQIEKSERRKTIIDHALAGSGVKLNNNRLETRATSANRSQRIHFLLTAILRLNDLWMTSTPRAVTDFFEIVKEYFDQNSILYTANKSITGRTVEHPIDFIIPLPKGKDRLVKLVPRPSLQASKLVSFTWVDLQESQPSAERIVLLNDITTVDADDTSLPDPARSISENALSILSGYSTRIYRWSEAANDAAFAQRIGGFVVSK